MDKKRYLARHWKYLMRSGHTLETISRKSKKAICQHFDGIAKEYEQDESFRLSGLPDCEYCGGSRYDPFDIGSYECEECEGTGKTGWVYQDGKRVPGKQVNHG